VEIGWPSKGARVVVREANDDDPARLLIGSAGKLPVRMGIVKATPADGGRFLSLDLEGDYGGVHYYAGEFERNILTLEVLA
jgi:hypothetical protein